MILRTIGQQFRKVCLSIPFSVALSGIAVLAYQSTTWVRLGYWKTMGSRLVLYKVLPSSFLHWLDNSKSWLGLKKITFFVFNLPLSLFLLLFGLLILVVATTAFDLFMKPGKKNPMNMRTRRCI